MPEDYTFWNELQRTFGSGRKNIVVTYYNHPEMGVVMFDLENLRAQQAILERGKIKRINDEEGTILIPWFFQICSAKKKGLRLKNML